MSVVIDQLRVSDDGKSLFLDAHVNKASYFSNLTIAKVTICTEDQVSETDPLSYGSEFIYQSEFSDTRSINLVLNANSFNEYFTATDLSHNLFFVYIECTGTPASDTPCRLDEMVNLAVTFDYNIVFNQAMNFTKQLSDKCKIPHEFLDFILNYEFFKIAIETEHYVPAITAWKRLAGLASNTVTSKRCSCYG